MKNKLEFIGKMFSVFDKKRKIQLGFLLVAIVISAVLELMGVTIILPFINIMMEPERVTEGGTLTTVYNLFGFESAVTFMVFLSIVITLVYIIKNVFLIFLNDLQFKFSYHNQRRLAHRIADIYMKQDYLFHTQNNRSDLMRDISTDTSMFFRVVLCFLQVITEICVSVVLLVFLFISDKTITIGITMVMMVFVVFYMKEFKNKIKNYGNETRLRQADMSRSLLQCLGGVKEIKLLDREKYFIEEFDNAYYGYAEGLRKNNLVSIIPKPIVETLCIGGIMLVVVVKLLMGTSMQYFVPTLTAFAVAAFRLLPSFNKITNNLNAIIFGKPSVDAVYNTIKRVNELNKQEEKAEKNQESSEIEFKEKISVSNVSFSYVGTETKVLNGIDIEIPKNASVAFIGPSGAGKTTLADIVLGILPPTEGCVKSDDVDIASNVKGWQRKLGYIPQSIFLLDDTLRKNIAMGIPDEEIDDDKVWTAIKHAQLDEHVKRMENGLDTMIGENGVRLSGGQRQRIGIARALYHNPEILVLDEATSALDNDTESAVMDAINHLSGTKTLIIIAHRLSTIENCDIVYEVNHGKVTEKKRK